MAVIIGLIISTFAYTSLHNVHGVHNKYANIKAY